MCRSIVETLDGGLPRRLTLTGPTSCTPRRPCRGYGDDLEATVIRSIYGLDADSDGPTPSRSLLSVPHLDRDVSDREPLRDDDVRSEMGPGQRSRSAFRGDALTDGVSVTTCRTLLTPAHPDRWRELPSEAFRWRDSQVGLRSRSRPDNHDAAGHLDALDPQQRVRPLIEVTSRPSTIQLDNPDKR
jgi:hypothetical protein